MRGQSDQISELLKEPENSLEDRNIVYIMSLFYNRRKVSKSKHSMRSVSLSFHRE